MSQPTAREIFKTGDTVLVITEHGRLYAGDGIEKLSEGFFRVYFSFMEGNKIFDSSVDVKEAEIKQVLRKGIAIWHNRA